MGDASTASLMHDIKEVASFALRTRSKSGIRTGEAVWLASRALLGGSVREEARGALRAAANGVVGVATRTSRTIGNASAARLMHGIKEVASFALRARPKGGIRTGEAV